MTRSHFQKIDDEEVGLHYAKYKFQLTKQHQKDSQNIKIGGLISFEENDEGLSSGRYFDLYQTHLNPKNDFLFQLPSTGKKFVKVLHLPQNGTVYYANSPVGKMLIAEMMPKVN